MKQDHPKRSVDVIRYRAVSSADSSRFPQLISILDVPICTPRPRQGSVGFLVAYPLHAGFGAVPRAFEVKVGSRRNILENLSLVHIFLFFGGPKRWKLFFSSHSTPYRQGILAGGTPTFTLRLRGTSFLHGGGATA